MPKLFAAILFSLTALMVIEQTILRRRPWWLARLAFFPMGRRAIALSEPVRAKLGDALDPSRLEWPADSGSEDLEVGRPAGDRAGWARLRAQAGKNVAGVARVVVVKEQETLVVRLDYYPATLAWMLGMVVLFSALILALAPWHVGIVLTAIVLMMWLVPARTAIVRARDRLSRLADRFAEGAAREPERSERKTKRRPRKSGR